MHTITNTKSNGRKMARELYREGMAPQDMVGLAISLMGSSKRPHMVAGLADVAFKLACWNGFCILERHEGDHHCDVTGYGWEQARGTKYCPVCHGHTACDH